MWLSRYQSDVLKFHKRMNAHVGNLEAPGFPSHTEADLRGRLVNEEGGETLRGIRARDPIETIDGLCDLLYVTLGTTISIGFDTAATLGSPSERTRAIPDLLFWRADDFERLLLSGTRLVCRAIESRDSFGTGVACLGLAAVTLGTAYAWGIPLKPFWDEVQRSNMQKIDAGPGLKAIKPVGWSPPDIRGTFADLYDLSRGI